MKLLITGAGGFVGAATMRAAAAAGHQVVGIIRPGGSRSRLSGAERKFSVVEIDLRNTDAIAALMVAERPDIVVHIAWSGVSNQARLDRSQITDNIDAACGLLDAGIAAGVQKFVGVGSQGEYGILSGRISEQHPAEPTSLYGAAKVSVLYLTRQLAAQAGISFSWIRLFSTYGPGDNPKWLIPSLIESMLDGTRPKTTAGEQRWDYLFIDDVAAGILAVATQANAMGVFNLGSGKPEPVRAIVEAIRTRVAPDMTLVFGEIAYSPDQIWHMEADISRLSAATGWRPAFELADGLDATVAWHRARRGEGGIT